MTKCVGCLTPLLSDAEFELAQLKADKMLETASGKEKETLTLMKAGLPRYALCNTRTINTDGDRLCGDCMFVIAVYKENGINKKFNKGGLQYHTLSSNVKKALDLLKRNPKLAYETYIPNMLKRCDGIEVSKSDMDAIRTEEFPFLKLPVSKAKELDIKDGSEVLLKTSDGEMLSRIVYAHKEFTSKQAKEYGYGRKAFVAYYLPATM